MHTRGGAALRMAACPDRRACAVVVAVEACDLPVQRLLPLARDLPGVLPGHPFAARASEGARERRVIEQRHDRVGERARVVRNEEVLAVADADALAAERR